MAAARRRGRVLAGFAFVADGRHLGDLSAGRLDSAHAYSDLLPQSEIEDILLTHLRGLGVEVQRPLELTGLTQTPGRVEVELRRCRRRPVRGARPVRRRRRRAHSATRGLLGLAFDGAGTQGVYVMDAVAEFGMPLPDDRGTFVLAAGGFLVVGRRPDGTHRIALSLPGLDDRISRARPTPRRAATAPRRLPRPRRPPRLGQLVVRVLPLDALGRRLRVGNVFVAGDAAHTHSPVGGQGMNTGIADAVNLALALDGRGGDELLDTYEAERLPVAKRLIRSTTTSTRPLLWRNPLAVALRNAGLRLVLAVPALQTRLFDGFTGFTVQYGRPPRLLDRSPRGPRVGDVAPENAAGAHRWHRRWGGDTKHQLLLFTGADLDLAAALAWADERSDVVRALLVTPQDRDGSVETVLDPTGELHRRFGAQRGASYLIRPDGHVAARAFDPDLAPLTAYADRVLRRAGVEPRPIAA